MPIKFKGSRIQKISGEQAPGGPAGEYNASKDALPCVHEWEVRPPRISKPVAEKRKALARAALQSRRDGDRSAAISALFEGRAARHNQVTEGDSMSGPNDASKLYVYCKKCKHRDREVDHVMRDGNDKIVGIVEVKSGNANIKPSQFDALQGICAQLGASLTYKIQRGSHAERAINELKKRGLAESNIIVI